VCVNDFFGSKKCKKLCHLSGVGECELICYDAMGSATYGVCLP